MHDSPIHRSQRIKTMIKNLILILICIIPLRIYSQNNSDFKKKDVFSLDNESLIKYKFKLNKSQGWKVVVENDSIKYAKYKYSNLLPNMSFPPNLNRKVGMNQEEGMANSIEVFNGWIVGIDAGEFGAGLFWYSKDGKTVDTLPSATRQMIKSGDNILGINGLHHMFSSYGNLVRIYFENNKWQVKTIYKFSGYPFVFTVDKEGNIYVITTYFTGLVDQSVDKNGNIHNEDHDNSALIRIDKNMQVHYLLKKGFWSMANPNSMELYKGSIYVGMCGGVLKVTEKKNSIEKEWFENCQK